MIEHPVPQNITEYQFHLIGNMTIKQFLILLVGVVLAFTFYSTNLPGIIKWPFMFIIVGGAGALAFVPYEERTLDTWLINFIRAIYRPTKYYWRRTAPTPEYFAFTSTKSKSATQSPTHSTQPQRQKQFSAYMSSLQTTAPQQAAQDPLDLFQGQGGNVTSLFESVEAAHNVTPGTTRSIEKPDLTVRARPLGSGNPLSYSQDTIPRSPSPIADLSGAAGQPNAQWGNTYSRSDSFTSFTIDSTQETPSANQKQETTTPLKPSGHAQTADVQTIHVEKSTLAPEEEKTSTPQATAVTAPETPNTSGVKRDTYLENEPTFQRTAEPTIPAVFDKSLPFPSLPEKPNILLGMVHNQQGSIIPGAIVEILDENGNTVRAMKTNNLGQFYISTPLKTGKYTLKTEAAAHSFPVYSLEINDSVLDPVDIQTQD